MLEHWIWLAHVTGVQEHEKIQLLEHFGSPEAVFYARNDQLEQLSWLKQTHREALLADRNLTAGQKILAYCADNQIGILTYSDEAYPERLKQIFHPPILLYYKGKLPDFDGNAVIGVVGTRKASAYGVNSAQRLSYEIGSCGGIVVSGMAEGIDAAAMSGAMRAGGTAVGVLGCGIDVIFPKKNKQLFQDTEQYGCILSEFAPGVHPAAWHFPKRNRIISGLSCGVLVVEAPEKSGALITARLATEQGRDIFVVPGNIDSPGFAGCYTLLKEGGGAVRSGWDVLEEYQDRFPDKLHKEPTPVQTAPKSKAAVAQKPILPRFDGPGNEKSIDNEPSAPYSDESVDLRGLTEEEKAVVQALTRGERLVEDVMTETGLSAGKMLGLLTVLELKKRVVRRPGKRVALFSE